MPDWSADTATKDDFDIAASLHNSLLLGDYQEHITKSSGILSVVADDADDFAHDFGVFIHRNGPVFGVFGGKMDDARLSNQAFNGGIFLSDPGYHNIAIFSGI